MKDRIKRLWEIFKSTDMTVLPGQVAFFFVLSLVPAATIIMYIVSFLPVSLEDINLYFNNSLDPTILEILKPTINPTASFSFNLIVVFIIGIYICSNGMHSIIVSADNIYGIKKKGYLERRIKSIIMVFFTIGLFLFMLVVPIFGNFILDFIEKIFGHHNILDFISVLKLPFTFFVVFLFIKILYTLAPDKQIPSRYVNNGALFTTVGWIISTYIYLYYAGNVANYSIYYSGLANIAILMIWMYILAYIFILGLSINYRGEEAMNSIEIAENSKGFTLVELLVVIAVIALIMTIAIPGINRASEQMRKKGLNSKISLIEKSTELYVQSRSNSFKTYTCNTNTSNCSCNGSYCEYVLEVSLQDVISAGYYTPDNSNGCLVIDSSDNTTCLENTRIKVRLHADYDTATACMPYNKACFEDLHPR